MESLVVKVATVALIFQTFDLNGIGSTLLSCNLFSSASWSFLASSYWLAAI